MKDPSELAVEIAERRASLLDRLARHERGETYEQIREEVEHMVLGFTSLVAAKDERIAELEADNQGMLHPGGYEYMDQCRRDAQIRARQAVAAAEELSSQLRRADAELVQLREANRWIPVEERMPEDWVDVLVYCEDKEAPSADDHVDLDQWDCDTDDWSRSRFDDRFKVTHWRPLPEGPGA